VCKDRSLPLHELIGTALLRAERLRAGWKLMVATTFAVCLIAPVLAQGSFTRPGWLESFPGASETVRSDDSSVEVSYTVDAQPAEVVAHYRKLFEVQGLVFQPNPDGMGTSIRVEAKECNLLILIRKKLDGTFTKVDCEAKTGAAVASAGPAGYKVDVTAGHGGKQSSTDWANRVQQHQQDMPRPKFNTEHRDMAAPALEWPEWLGHVRGAPLEPKKGLDPGKREFMSARYTTNVPMTEIFDFYNNLLKGHDYRPRGELATGHTQSGIQQNALGRLDAFNYPEGFPGAYSEVEVTMDRTVLNGPITVLIYLRTHDYKAGGN
jgi:hypothetical protein